MKNLVKRSEANTAQKLIIDTDEGAECFLMVKSAHSDDYRNGKLQALRNAAETLEGGIDDDSQAKILASMLSYAIVDWSLPEEFGEFTREKAEELLFEYPQICEAVDIFISSNKNFIEKKPKA